MTSLKRIAEKELVLCDLMVDKDKIDTEEIIETFEKGITLDKIDFYVQEKNGVKEEVFVYTFKENKRVFAFAGLILKKLFKSWIDCYGSVEDVNSALRVEEIVIKLTKDKTNDDREITRVEVL